MCVFGNNIICKSDDDSLLLRAEPEVINPIIKVGVFAPNLIIKQ